MIINNLISSGVCELGRSGSLCAAGVRQTT